MKKMLIIVAMIMGYLNATGQDNYTIFPKQKVSINMDTTICIYVDTADYIHSKKINNTDEKIECKVKECYISACDKYSYYDTSCKSIVTLIPYNGQPCLYMRILLIEDKQGWQYLYYDIVDMYSRVLSRLSMAQIVKCPYF